MLQKSVNQSTKQQKAIINGPSLYIHIPFCEKKCFYCSFAVSVGQRHRVDDYLNALFLEAQRYDGTAFETLYIGGGTPSFMDEPQIATLFKALHEKFNLKDCCELTIEANPEGLNFAKAKLFKDLGVTRVSLGVQSLQDENLKYLGRCHDSHAAVDAFQILRKAGFENINLDLMFSCPGQSDDDVEKDVRAICSLGSEHLSLYALTIEPNSRFFTKKIQLSPDDVRAAQYELIVGLLDAHGLRQYEVSNFAKPGYESRHNMIYWLGGNYIGLGMSAHSHIDGRRFWNVAKLTEYISRASQNIDPREAEEILTPDQRLAESLLIGLRMNQGVNIEELETRFGCRLAHEKSVTIEDLAAERLLTKDGGLVKTTLQGRLVLDEMSARLI